MENSILELTFDEKKKRLNIKNMITIIKPFPTNIKKKNNQKIKNKNKHKNMQTIFGIP